MSKQIAPPSKPKKGLNTRQIAMAGVLGGICMVLGLTGLGMIPIPTLAGRATIMHVPVILAGILEGPIVGGLTGLIMGIYSFATPSGAIPQDPLVRILPRILIGVVSALAFRAARGHISLGAALAGILGTITNTVGFVGLAVVMGYLPLEAVVAIVPQFIAELILATVLCVMLTKALGSRLWK